MTALQLFQKPQLNIQLNLMLNLSLFHFSHCIHDSSNTHTRRDTVTKTQSHRHRHTNTQPHPYMNVCTGLFMCICVYFVDGHLDRQVKLCQKVYLKWKNSPQKRVHEETNIDRYSSIHTLARIFSWLDGRSLKYKLKVIVIFVISTVKRHYAKSIEFYHFYDLSHKKSSENIEVKPRSICISHMSLGSFRSDFIFLD